MSLRLKSLASLVVDQADRGELPYVALEHLESGTGALVPGVELPIRRGGEPGVGAVRQGDVLFGKLRPYLAKTLLVHEPAYASTELMALRPRSGVEARYFAYLVGSKPLIEWATAGSDGVKMPRTSWEKLSEFRVVNIPELTAQRSIADYLDTETARIDALIEKKQRLVALLANRHRQLVREVTLSSGEDRALRRVVTMIKTGSTPRTTSESLEGGFEWATPGDFTDGLQLQFTARQVPRKSVEAGETPVFPSGSILVVGIGATAGRIAFAERAVSSNQQVTAISPRHEVDGKFLAWQLWCRSDDLRELAPFTTLPILNNEFLRSFVVKIPSLGVQRRIAVMLDQHWTRTEDLQIRIRRQVDLLRERRQVLITAAVTGELEISGVAA